MEQLSQVDCFICGAGPAGLSAGMYLGRYNSTVLIAESSSVISQLLWAGEIHNYPGFWQGITGQKLYEQMRSHALRFGARIQTMDVISVSRRNQEFVVRTGDGETVSKSFIIATGARYKQLDVPGEKELIGKGVSYCALCDGPLMKGLRVAVIGGGDRAAEEALFLSRYAEKVYLIHRRHELRAAQVLCDAVNKIPSIEMVWDTVVTGICGDSGVRSLSLKHIGNFQERQLQVSAVFVCIGAVPNTEIFRGVVKTEENGLIYTDEDMCTTVQGIFACGDVRKKTLYQVVSACAEGAVAAASCYRYLDKLKRG